jgi:hypothetical protein
MGNLKWRKAVRSGANGQQCVEVARVSGSARVAARDSKDPEGPQLRFAADEWHRFLTAVKAHQYEI